MENINVGVILGGYSPEREISILSGRAVSAALRRKGYTTAEVGIDGNIEQGILTSGIDIAFIALHGSYGEDGTIQKFLEDTGIPYTGSGQDASRKAMDKAAAKSIFIKNNIPTPQYLVIEFGRKGMPLQINKITDVLSFPMVTKPVNGGSSIGFEIITDQKHLRNTLGKASQYSRNILAEQYVSGRELTVGILEDAPLPVVEIVPKEDCYDYMAKYTAGMTEYIVPARLPAGLYRYIQLTALKAHRALGCRDMSRVDIRLDRKGIPWVLEINTIPGFTETSLMPKAAASIGLGFDDLCTTILKLALRRRDICPKKS